MGLRDILTGRSSVKQPAAHERLFALSTAYVTLETSYQITSAGVGGIVVQSLATSDFQSVLDDTEEVVKATAGDLDAKVETRDDEFGFRWVIVRTPAVEDLVVAINGVSSSIEGGGYGERLLCAVFSFKGAEGAPINFIYNYKRGSWYPFVPAAGDKQRNTERELQLKAQIGGELPIEPELERWFPLWGVPF
jgi:hypothetical protein